MVGMRDEVQDSGWMVGLLVVGASDGLLDGV